jgi:hypothetical protein
MFRGIFDRSDDMVGRSISRQIRLGFDGPEILVGEKCLLVVSSKDGASDEQNILER